VALNATGNIGTNAGSRLATRRARWQRTARTYSFAETDAVTLNTVNSVTNTATTTYDLTATAITVTGANVGAGTNTFLDGSSITERARWRATNVALNATGNIGTNAGSRLATAAGTLAAHGANVFIAETDAVTLNTVNSVTNTATNDL